MIFRVFYVALVTLVLITTTDSVQDVVRVLKQTPLMTPSMPSDSSPMVSAVLLECPREPKLESDPVGKSKRPPCEEQLMVNIRVNPSFHIEEVEKFLILDEVYDARRHSKAKIMSPYLIEISRGEPVMMYPLEFTKSVKCEQCDPQRPISRTQRTDKSVEGTCDSNQSKMDKLEIYPSQATINRETLTDTASPVTKLRSAKGINRTHYRNDNTKSISAKKEVRALYSDYDISEGDHTYQWSPNDGVYDSEQVQIQNPIGSKDISDLIQKLHTKSNTQNGQLMANVGIDDQLNRKLQPRIKLAQLGSVRPSIQIRESSERIEESRTKLKPEEIRSTTKESLERRNSRSRQNVVPNQYATNTKFRKDSEDVEALLANSEFQYRDLQPEAGVHEDPEEFNDEMDPISYMQRKITKRRRFGLGRKGGRRKRPKFRHHKSMQPELQLVDEADTDENFNDGLDEVDLVRKSNLHDHIKSCSCKNKVELESKDDRSNTNYVDSGDNADDADFEDDGKGRFKYDIFPKNLQEVVTPHKLKKNNKFVFDENEDDDTIYEDLDITQRVPQKDSLFLPNRRQVQKPVADNTVLKHNIQLSKRMQPFDGDTKQKEYGEPMSFNLNEKKESRSADRIKQNHDEVTNKMETKARRYVTKEKDHFEYRHPNRIGPKAGKYSPPKKLSLKRKFSNPSDKEMEKNSNEIYEPNRRTYTTTKFNGNQRNLHKNQNTPKNHYYANGKNVEDYEPSKVVITDRSDDSSDDIDNGLPRTESLRNNYNNKVSSDDKNRDNSLLARERLDEVTPDYSDVNRQFEPEVITSKGEFNSNNGIYDSANDAELPFYNADLKPQLKTNLNEYKENMAKNMGFESLWSAPSPEQTMLEPSELLDNFNAELPIRRHQPISNRDKYYDTAIGQPPRSISEELINQEPSQFLPKKPPYAKIIDDPNLNINDKLSIIEVIDPHNENTDRKLCEYSQELQNPFLEHTTTYPIAFAPEYSMNARKRPDNTKRKRSFLFYDDLEMRNNIEDNDYDMDKIDPHPPQSSSAQEAKEDVQPCSSCGKGKKPHSKTDSSEHLADNSVCQCRSQRNSACSCSTAKRVRSVSDAWYSVFNMSAPLPFLTTKIQIFRKRRNTWWKIAPSITLNSLSGIFANANLSILFSSHVDIFQLEKSLRLQNHQLLIPKDDQPLDSRQHAPKAKNAKQLRRTESKSTENEFPNLDALSLNPNNILAVDSNKLNFNSFQIQSNALDDNPNSRQNSFIESNKLLCNDIFELIGKNPIKEEDATASLDSNKPMAYKRDATRSVDNGIRKIADLGYFPATMNLLERCPNDQNRLCLNMLDDRVPEYSIKVKMPFRENDIIHGYIFKIKIATIITDATTKDALQVSVHVINEGLEAHEFSIHLSDCATCASAAKTSVNKFLIPHVAETVNFLLPLIVESNLKHKKFNCDVIVKTMVPNVTAKSDATSASPGPPNAGVKNIIVSKRSLTVEPGNRCFCVWECHCHCIPKLETHEDFNVCRKLDYNDKMQAGLLLNFQPGEETEDVCLNDSDDVEFDENERSNGFFGFLNNALILLAIILILGLLKATLGRLCSTRVDRWGYGYVQPGKGYDNSSQCRRFFVNTIFFIVFPFLFWCKCFTPSEEDLLVASTEWQCLVEQEVVPTTSYYKFPDGERHNIKSTDDDDEDVILSQHIDQRSNPNKPTDADRLLGGQDLFDMNNRLTNLTLAFHDGMFDDEDDEDDEANTKYILQALVESRESLKKLMKNQSSQKVNLTGEEAAKLKQSEEYVQTLLAAQIVYRVFDRPVGNVRNISVGRKYCVQGYFLSSLDGGYEFVNYNPLAQHCCISANGNSVEVLRPPIMLCPNDFARVYKNELEVFDAADLFTHPPPNTPCINISTIAGVASSIVKLVSEQNRCSNSVRTTPQNQRDILKVCNLPLEEEEMEEADQCQTSFRFSIDNDEDLLDNVSREIIDEISDIDIGATKSDGEPEGQ